MLIDQLMPEAPRSPPKPSLPSSKFFSYFNNFFLLHSFVVHLWVEPPSSPIIKSMINNLTPFKNMFLDSNSVNFTFTYKYNLTHLWFVMFCFTQQKKMKTFFYLLCSYLFRFCFLIFFLSKCTLHYLCSLIIIVSLF